MGVTVMGASVGAQHIGGDVNNYEWRVSYQIDGRGRYFHTVSSRDAGNSQEALEVAKRELEQYR